MDDTPWVWSSNFLIFFLDCSSLCLIIVLSGRFLSYAFPGRTLSLFLLKLF